MTRPGWAETWMSIAETIALRSRCVRAQVGAVVVTHDNRIGSVAYNGPPSRMILSGDCSNWCSRAQGKTELGSDYSGCSMIHAEENALLRADFTDIHGGTIYVSRSMCINCAKLVANSGLDTVTHRVIEADLHRDPDGVENYLREAGMKARRFV